MLTNHIYGILQSTPYRINDLVRREGLDVVLKGTPGAKLESSGIIAAALFGRFGVKILAEKRCVIAHLRHSLWLPTYSGVQKTTETRCVTRIANSRASGGQFVLGFLGPGRSSRENDVGRETLQVSNRRNEDRSVAQWTAPGPLFLAFGRQPAAYFALELPHEYQPVRYGNLL